MVGGDGVAFYFHGHKDADFCLVSDSNLHINAHFIGRRNEGMRRDFTWVQSLGILFGTHQLYIGANKVASFDNSVDHFTLAFDASPVVLPPGAGAAWTTPYDGVKISRTEATNFLTVEVENQFSLHVRVVPVSQEENLQHNYGIQADNCFAHLELSFTFHSLSPSVAGVLGQTYRPDFTHTEVVKPGQSMRTLHNEVTFSSSSLMKPDCSVSRFNGVSSSEVLQNLPQLSCNTEGKGLVCRR